VYNTYVLNIELSATPKEYLNRLLIIINYNTTTSYSKHLRVKEIGKQSNLVNLYYLNFLEIVILHPLLVILSSST
jgi:hypothetical protein